MSTIIRRDEFEELRARVERIEHALYSFFSDNNLDIDGFDGGPDQDYIASVAEISGVMFGCVVDPIQLQIDPTMAKIGKEFNLIQCPKASIPTKERVSTEFGPLIDFKKADEIVSYARKFGIDVKDGPYINIQNPNHDVSLRINDVSRWVVERLGRPGAEDPMYIDIITDFLDDDGKLIDNPIFQNTNIFNFITQISHLISDSARDSGIGISLSIPRLFSEYNPPKLKVFCDMLERLLAMGAHLNFVGLKMEVDVSEKVSHDTFHRNINLIKPMIDEIHIHDFMVSNKNDSPEPNAAPLYEDIMTALDTENAVTMFGIGSLSQVANFCQGPFNSKMGPTTSYKAIKQGFYQMSR